MGNQCTPRSCQRSVPNPQNVNIFRPVNQIRSAREINLAPKIKEPEGVKTQTLQKFMSCQNGNDLEKSCQSQRTKAKDHIQAIDSNQTQTIKECILQNLETQPTLMDERKSSKKSEVDQKLNSSVFSKSNIKVAIEGPSQVRDSVVSAWNKSDFDQSDLMKPIKYDELFMPVVDNNSFHKK